MTIDKNKILTMLKSDDHSTNILGLIVLRSYYPGWNDFKCALNDIISTETYTRKLWNGSFEIGKLYNKYFYRVKFELLPEYFTEID